MTSLETCGLCKSVLYSAHICIPIHFNANWVKHSKSPMTFLVHIVQYNYSIENWVWLKGLRLCLKFLVFSSHALFMKGFKGTVSREKLLN